MPICGLVGRSRQYKEMLRIELYKFKVAMPSIANQLYVFHFFLSALPVRQSMLNYLGLTFLFPF
jgi:hypothetical protein